MFTELRRVHGATPCSRSYAVFTELSRVHGAMPCSRSYPVFTELCRVHRALLHLEHAVKDAIQHEPLGLL